MSFEDVQHDEKTQDAVIRNFEIIGKAAKRLPEQITTLYHDVEWAKIIGFRNILVHEYHGGELETVWSAVETKVHDLENQTKVTPGEGTWCSSPV
jgi:uncharacterized protein with HEPN domain